jgi:hypothetical protein
MSHPLLLGLFDGIDQAARVARRLHEAGIARDDLSIVSKSHEQEGVLARQFDGTPGVDIEDSRPAARLGELGGLVLAAIAVVMPGIGPIVAAGPLAAGMGEAAGHLAGGVRTVLSHAGVDEERARDLERAVEQGSVLMGVHVRSGDVARIRRILEEGRARTVDEAQWE